MVVQVWTEDRSGSVCPLVPRTHTPLSAELGTNSQKPTWLVDLEAHWLALHFNMYFAPLMRSSWLTLPVLQGRCIRFQRVKDEESGTNNQTPARIYRPPSPPSHAPPPARQQPLLSNSVPRTKPPSRGPRTTPPSRAPPPMVQPPPGPPPTRAPSGPPGPPPSRPPPRL